jgi:hypothetical protein
MVSFHILIATIARPTLQNLLDSLFPYLTSEDHVTIVFDGVEPIRIHGKTNAKIHLYHEPIALGFWGHGIRNKYAEMLDKTDFVMHADDDDIYTPITFPRLRSMCTNTETLYVTKMKLATGRIVPKEPIIREDNIGTPNGVIPYEANKIAKWGLGMGGDARFYEELAQKIPAIFLDILTYIVRP